MAIPGVGTTAGSTVASDILTSVRAQIPDIVTDITADGNDFSLATLLLWLNDAMRIMATSAPIIQDWHAIASEEGMDIYELPSRILSVEQLWYDSQPCVRVPELDMLWSEKVTSRSYYFGPHSIHATPRIHVSPAADRTSLSTTTTGALTATTTTIPLTSVTGLQDYGYIKVEDEIIMYRTISTLNLTQVLRGQAGTTATTHASGAAVTELNIFFKCSRLPVPVTTPSDIVEIPIGLTPIIELYILSKVRRAEQEVQEATLLSREFQAAVQTLQDKAQLKGLRQGLQVRAEEPGPLLYSRGRLFVP